MTPLPPPSPPPSAPSASSSDAPLAEPGFGLNLERGDARATHDGESTTADFAALLDERRSVPARLAPARLPAARTAPVALESDPRPPPLSRVALPRPTPVLPLPAAPADGPAEPVPSYPDRGDSDAVVAYAPAPPPLPAVPPPAPPPPDSTGDAREAPHSAAAIDAPARSPSAQPAQPIRPQGTSAAEAAAAPSALHREPALPPPAESPAPPSSLPPMATPRSGAPPETPTPPTEPTAAERTTPSLPPRSAAHSGNTPPPAASRIEHPSASTSRPATAPARASAPEAPPPRGQPSEHFPKRDFASPAAVEPPAAATLRVPESAVRAPELAAAVASPLPAAPAPRIPETTLAAPPKAEIRPAPEEPLLPPRPAPRLAQTPALDARGAEPIVPERPAAAPAPRLPQTLAPAQPPAAPIVAAPAAEHAATPLPFVVREAREVVQRQPASMREKPAAPEGKVSPVLEDAPTVRGERTVAIRSLIPDKQALAKASAEVGTAVAGDKHSMSPRANTAAPSSPSREQPWSLPGVAAPSLERAPAAPAPLPTMPTPSEAETAPLRSAAATIVREIANLIERGATHERSTLELRLPAPAGDSLVVRLAMRGDAVQTTFRTDSPELRDWIAREWENWMPRLAERGVRVAEPTFDARDPAGASSDRGAPQGHSSAHHDSSRHSAHSQARDRQQTGEDLPGLRSRRPHAAAPAVVPVARLSPAANAAPTPVTAPTGLHTYA